jgi:hypothetical protein
MESNRLFVMVPNKCRLYKVLRTFGSLVFEAWQLFDFDTVVVPKVVFFKLGSFNCHFRNKTCFFDMTSILQFC